MAVIISQLPWPEKPLSVTTPPGRCQNLLGKYRRTLETDRRYLLEQYEYADMARKVFGVGSVGTRCWIVLMLGRDESDPLFLQVKEARRRAQLVATRVFLGRRRSVVAWLPGAPFGNCWSVGLREYVSKAFGGGVLGGALLVG